MITSLILAAAIVIVGTWMYKRGHFNRIISWFKKDDTTQQ